jgi:hypothetical protein
MTKLRIFYATILAAACAASGVEAAAPKTCTGLWDFIETDCQLTWYGITVYGTIDAGVGWQSHGAPGTFDASRTNAPRPGPVTTIFGPQGRRHDVIEFRTANFPRCRLHAQAVAAAQCSDCRRTGASICAG